MLLLTLCVTVSSVGVALSERLCLMTGQWEVEVPAYADSCSGKSTTSEVEGYCAAKVPYINMESVFLHRTGSTAPAVSLPGDARPCSM